MFNTGKRWLLMGMLLVPLFCYLIDAHAFGWHDLWRTPDQQGAKLFAEDQAVQAATQFENENWKAIANYRAGDYQQALEDFAKGDNAQADYNRANALAHLGQYEAAIAAYGAALEADPNNEDARFNQQIVEQLLNQQQQNQDQDQSQGHGQNEQSSNQQNNGQQNSNQQQQPPQDNGDGQADELPQPPAADDQSQQSQTNNQDMMPDQQTQQNMDEQDINDQKQPAEQLSAQQQQEQQNSAEQLLRQVPDDPGGLLRQKFLRDHLRKQQQGFDDL